MTRKSSEFVDATFLCLKPGELYEKRNKFRVFSPRKRVGTAQLNTIRYQEYYWLKNKTQAKNRAAHSTTGGEAEQ